MELFEGLVLITVLIFYWVAIILDRRLDIQMNCIDTLSGSLAAGQKASRQAHEMQELKNQAMIGYIQALQARVEGKPIDPESLNTNR